MVGVVFIAAETPKRDIVLQAQAARTFEQKALYSPMKIAESQCIEIPIVNHYD